MMIDGPLPRCATFPPPTRHDLRPRSPTVARLSRP